MGVGRMLTANRESAEGVTPIRNRGQAARRAVWDYPVGRTDGPVSQPRDP